MGVSHSSDAGNLRLAERAVQPSTSVAPGDVLDPETYLRDPELRPAIDFWIKVFSRYYSHQGIFHDSKHLNVIYEVVDLRSFKRGARGAGITRHKKKWRDILLRVHEKQSNPDRMSPEELHVYRLYSGIQEPNKFLKAAQRKRLRMQHGQRDSFETALRNSGKFMKHMETVFREQGVPPLLTRIPFIESAFNMHALSHAGASGIWQFIPSTGRRFLKVTNAIDERNDPIKATVAAARLLRENFEELKSWPLAAIAYNHGRRGMMQAIRTLGSYDLKKVLNFYKSRTFGFAGKNYFIEILAVYEIEKNADRYFRIDERRQPVDFVEVSLRHYVHYSQLIKHLKIDRARFNELNGALTAATKRDKYRIPAGYTIRLPVDWGAGNGGSVRLFWNRYNRMPSSRKYSSQVGEGAGASG